MDLLTQADHSLGPDQINMLLSKASSDNPLWLTIACKELSVTPDPTQHLQCIQDLPDALLE